jgi:cobalt-zinc-cadmium resistance protein CzcA
MNTKNAFMIADTILKAAYFVGSQPMTDLNTNPVLGSIKQQIDIARYEKQLEQRKMLPDFSIGYFSQTMKAVQDGNAMPSTYGTNERFTGYEAGIAIPLWFTPYTAKSKAAKQKEQIAQTNAEYYKQSLWGNYSAMLGEFTKYAHSIDYYEKQALPEATIIIEQAGKSYKLGAMDYLDYIISLNTALGIKQKYIDVVNNYNQTIINLEFITGKTF